MSVRMTHPRHGTTFAVGAEVDWNQKNGWKVEEKPVKEPAIEELATEEVEAPRRGRPPRK